MKLSTQQRDLVTVGPDTRNLGLLATGASLCSLALAMSYFLSPLAYVAAAVAMVLGLLSRGHARSHAMGNAAIGLAVIACVAATYLLATIP